MTNNKSNNYLGCLLEGVELNDSLLQAYRSFYLILQSIFVTIAAGLSVVVLAFNELIRSILTKIFLNCYLFNFWYNKTRMNKIKIQKQNSERIKITFPNYNYSYISKIKSIEGYKWHPEEKFWTIPNTNGNLQKIIFIFGKEEIVIDQSLQKKLNQNLEELKRELIIRKYSKKTINAYIYHNEEFLNFCKKEYKDIADEDIKNYLYFLTDVFIPLFWRYKNNEYIQS